MELTRIPATMSKYKLPRNIQFIFNNEELKYKLSSKSLFVSEQIENIYNCQIRPNQVNQYLGQEVDFLFYDAASHFDVNQFVAIVGCLVGGGTLVVKLPGFYKEIISSIDNQTNQALSLPNHRDTSQLLLRFVQQVIKAQAKTDKQAPSNGEQSKQFNLEQDRLISKIERCALGHAKRPLIITADRGRGKSTALAKACAALCYIHAKKIILTAPRKENLNIFYTHFNQELERLSSSETNQNHQFISNSIQKAKHQIEFFAIDRVIQNNTEHPLLVIDEAGSFPVQVLEKVIKKFNRMVLSSTISGYEGNGRGFEIKFLPLLAKSFPQYRSEKLTIPYRWQSNDLLEHCCNNAFLMAQPSLNLALQDKLTIKYCFINKENLLNNETLLSSIFSLLTEAHYQTRPSDLEKILTDPLLLVYIGIDQNHQVISACLIVQEGNIDDSDCVKISHGKLRLKGQLIPQSLISTKGILAAGKLIYWRIMRIAVAPSLQNRSVGSEMIEYIITQAKSKNVDILGTSFALSPALFNFWNLLNFHCCRVALRIDSSTGLIPADFLQPISKQGVLCSEIALSQFNRSFVYSSASSYKYLDPKLLINIMFRQIARQYQPIYPHTIEAIQTEVENYINNARSFEMVEYQLLILTQHFLAINTDEVSRVLNLDMLFAKVYQRTSWTELSLNYSLKGKNEVTKLIKNCIQQIYAIIYRSGS